MTDPWILSLIDIYSLNVGITCGETEGNPMGNYMRSVHEVPFSLQDSSTPLRVQSVSFWHACWE
jgi:hypothetical protein